MHFVILDVDVIQQLEISSSNNITMIKNYVVTNTDQKIKTHDGWVCGMEILPAEVNFAAFLTNDEHKHYGNINYFHELLGHPSEATTRKTANEMKVIMTGQFALHVVNSSITMHTWLNYFFRQPCDIGLMNQYWVYRRYVEDYIQLEDNSR